MYWSGHCRLLVHGSWYSCRHRPDRAALGTLASGGDDGAVILWDMSGLKDIRDHAVERACALAGGGLTPTEWADLVGLPYQRTC